MAGGATTTGEEWAGATSEIPLHQWTHVAATWDGTTVRTYINGVADTTVALTGTIVATNDPLWMGWALAGHLDEVRLYHRALSASEIAVDMNTPTPLAPMLSVGTIDGAVMSTSTGMAIAGATVEALQNGVVQATTSTSSSGAYSLPNLAAGSYDVRASATNYLTQTQIAITVTSGTTTTTNFQLVPVSGGTGTITGTVTSSSVAVAGATVEVLQGGQTQATTSTSSSGTYSLPNLVAGVYDLRVSATNYQTQTQPGVIVTNGATTTANFDLVPSGGGGGGGGTPSGDTVTYYHTDAIGSVRMITSATGQVVARYDFLPFGGSWNPPPNPDVRQFAGKERDAETNFDYFGARYYQSQNARFTRPDDPGFGDPFDPQSMNLYTYARNNPLRYVDPSGHDPCPTGSQATFCTSVIGELPGFDDFSLQFFRESTFNLARQLAQPPDSGRPRNLSDGTPRQFWGPFTQGFNAAKNALQKNKCGSFYGSQGPATMDATNYRFIDMNSSATAAATLSANLVVINSTGPYMTSVPTGQGGPFGRFWTQGQFRGFILLHELGHQLSAQTGFRGDAGRTPLNEAQSRRVLSACF